MNILLEKLLNNQKIITFGAVSFAVFSNLFLWLKFYPYVGTDHDFVFPKMLDTYAFIRKNGLIDIQMWTSLGGGTPAYGDPQSYQFSLPTLLNLIFTPYISILITIVVMTLIGWFSCREILKFIVASKTGVIELVATMFMVNGFYIQHMLAGHYNYNMYPLCFLAIYLLFVFHGPSLLTASLLSLVGSYVIYAGGYYMALIILMACILSWPLFSVIKGVSLIKTLRIAVMSAAIALALSISKLNAVYDFMRNYPRLHDTEVMTSLMSPLYALFFVPYWKFMKWLSDGGLSFTNIGESIYGVILPIWEMDFSLNPVLIFYALAGLILLIKKDLRKNYIPVLIFLGLLFIYIVIITGKTALFPYIKSLPLFKSLHVNARFLSAIFPSLLILVGFAIAMRLKKINEVKFLMMAVLVHGFFYFNFYMKNNHALELKHDSRIAIQIYKDASKNPLEITCISDQNDLGAMSKGCVSSRTYQPIFGYDLEKFKPKSQLAEGSIQGLKEGYFNFHDPRQFISNNHLLDEKLSLIPLEDQENLVRLLSYDAPNWAYSDRQRVANFISLMGIIFILLFITLYFFKKVAYVRK